MRKGSLLAEVLVALAVIFIVSSYLASLSTIMIRDIPKIHRVIESNTSALNALKQMCKDINSARGLPQSFMQFGSNNELLLIELADYLVCYQIEDGRLIRHKLSKNLASEKEDTEIWRIPNAKIDWRVWRMGDRGYAVEVHTHIEQRSMNGIEKKMANSYLYFAGACPEAVR